MWNEAYKEKGQSLRRKKMNDMASGVNIEDQDKLSKQIKMSKVNPGSQKTIT